MNIQSQLSAAMSLRCATLQELIRSGDQVENTSLTVYCNSVEWLKLFLYLNDQFKRFKINHRFNLWTKKMVKLFYLLFEVILSLIFHEALWGQL